MSPCPLMLTSRWPASAGCPRGAAWAAKDDRAAPAVPDRGVAGRREWGHGSTGAERDPQVQGRAPHRRVVAGVDTYKYIHVAVAIDDLGTVLGSCDTEPIGDSPACGIPVLAVNGLRSLPLLVHSGCIPITVTGLRVVRRWAAS